MRRILTILLLALAVSGCTGMELPPMGEAYRQQLASQTLNPDAGGDAPVTGLYGPRAEQVMDGWIAGDTNEDDSGVTTQMTPQ